MGETGRMLRIRLTEHQRAVRNQNGNNGIAVHVMKTHHSSQWMEARVLVKEPYLTKRKVKEGLIIRRTKRNNYVSGFEKRGHFAQITQIELLVALECVI